MRVGVVRASGRTVVLLQDLERWSSVRREGRVPLGGGMGQASHELLVESTNIGLGLLGSGWVREGLDIGGRVLDINIGVGALGLLLQMLLMLRLLVLLRVVVARVLVLLILVVVASVVVVRLGCLGIQVIGRRRLGQQRHLALAWFGAIEQVQQV
jgi:hypothetical protein